MFKQPDTFRPTMKDGELDFNEQIMGKPLRSRSKT